jgi:hypothetical protein
MKSKFFISATVICLLLYSPIVKAQSFGNISLSDLEKSAKSLSSSTKNIYTTASTTKSAKGASIQFTDNNRLVGLWNFDKTSCKFKSENIFKKAGGAIAAKAVESELNDKCKEVGIEKGNFSIQFNNDRSFITKWETHTITGTYVYDELAGKTILKYNILLSMDATSKLNDHKLTLLFDADKLLKLFSFMGGLSGDIKIRTAAKFAKAYDGMLVGFEMKR